MRFATGPVGPWEIAKGSAFIIIAVAGIAGWFLDFLPGNGYGIVVSIAAVPVARYLIKDVLAKEVTYSSNPRKARLSKALVFVAIYMVVWSAFGYAFPALLHHGVGTSFDETTEVTEQHYYYRMVHCQYWVELKDIGTVFDDDICLDRAQFEALPVGTKVQIEGIRSPLGESVRALHAVTIRSQQEGSRVH